MKKILKKRAVAFVLDVLLFAVFFVIVQKCFSKELSDLGSFGYFLILFPFFFKDIVFRNASIGKKVVGIAIYNENWEKPSFFDLIKRSCFMTTIGFFHLWKTVFLGNDLIYLFIWEQDCLKTRVVDKSSLKRIKEKCCTTGIETKEKMTQCYNDYLRSGHI